jgi:hypothetical protein
VVIADKPLTEYVPLCRVTGKDDIITQWSMGDVEAAGPLEDGLPGPAEPDDPAKAVDLIEQTTGQRVDPSSSRWTTSRRSRCCSAARRRASSSSKAAAFATSCRR